MKRILFLTSIMGLLFAAPVLAGIGKGNGEIGFDFGGTEFDRGLIKQDGPRLAFRGGYHLTRLFEIEGQVGASVHYHFDALLGRGGSRRADTSLRTIFAEGVFNFHSKGGNVVPYVLGGVGSGTLDFPLANASDSGAAYIIAGGSRFFFGDRDQVAFRLEVSRISLRAFDADTNHVNATAGFTWRIGD